ncbi:ATP-binding protein [Actinoplanes sp. CA-015351]|uniref:ATP-binding protein n=1 Tax=Actinoplanes sp. CA-015351 TaxID=3239897 RepID=UPI003D95B307
MTHPTALTDREATLLAYGRDIRRAASLLKSGLSVLIHCDKAVGPHLWESMVHQANRRAVLVAGPGDPQVRAMNPRPPMPGLRLGAADDLAEDTENARVALRTFRQRYLDEIREKLALLKDDEVLVMLHLDLLASSVESTLAPEVRELVELLYGPGGMEATLRQAPNVERVLLGFVEPTLVIPQVLAKRFVVPLTLSGIGPTVSPEVGVEQPSAAALVLAQEAKLFAGYKADEMYKHLAGLHPVRLRQAMRYAYDQHQADPPSEVAKLRQTLREFKADTSGSFELPNVRFDDIGGYDDVKREMADAIRILMDPHAPRQVRRSLPRGYIFCGPPGTGKTMFAKAIANEMDATINVVSGPEVTSMYFGESERRVRELFAEARRNAPSVIVFDEIDAIAGRRSSHADGGARANNAIVAQILTEMDGFREELTMLVIGTTNQVNLIDRALLRPSRFQQVEIGLPDPDARRKIIEVCAAANEITVPPKLMPALVQAMTDWNGDEIRVVFARVTAAAYRRKAKMKAGLPVGPEAPIETLLGKIVGQMQRSRLQDQASRREG